MLLKVLEFNNNHRVLIRAPCVSFGVDRSNNSISKGAIINNNGVSKNFTNSITISKKSKKYLSRKQKIPGEKKGFLLKIFEFNNKLGVLIKVV